jgi:hypothetical protein
MFSLPQESWIAEAAVMTVSIALYRAFTGWHKSKRKCSLTFFQPMGKLHYSSILDAFTYVFVGKPPCAGTGAACHNLCAFFL